jgi:hypothetical protein
MELYSSNPRALFESDEGIRPILLARQIPCGQSPALNIAKASAGLNEQLAAQRRPKSDAEATLRLVDWAMEQPEDVLVQFGNELGRRFDLLAQAVISSQSNLPANTTASRLISTSIELIKNHPDGGTIPQLLCGIAVEAEFIEQKERVVFGARDSASATNRTAKKVGDVSVEHPQYGNIRIYEITVKKFGEQRVNEAVQSLRSYFSGRLPAGVIVQVLCRPEDVPPSATRESAGIYMGTLESGGALFEFINIFEWLAGKIAEFSIKQREYYFNEVQEFLNTGKNGRIPSEIRKAWISGFS